VIAIRLTQANYHRILNESPIQERDLRAMIEEYDRPDNPLYFVPLSNLTHELSEASWMTLPKVHLDAKYTYDASQIEHKFVEIHEK